jgi:hypothetical protein
VERAKSFAVYTRVMSFVAIAFFLFFGTFVAPSFTRLYAEAGHRVPALAVLSVRPSTSYLCAAALAAGVYAGYRRPAQRTVIFALVAGAGVAVALLMFASFFLNLLTVFSAVPGDAAP